MPLPALSVSPAASPRSSSLLSPATPLPAETDTLIPNITLRRPSFPVSQSMDSLCMSSKPVIRHAHTGSDLSMVSNLTTHSEDLTAKEFADMAGITILPEDDDDAFLDDAILNDSLADLVEDLDLGSILHEKQSIASSSLISRHCSMRSNKSLPRLQIWDSGFWQTNPSSPHVPPILHELRRIQSTNLQPHPRLQLRRNKSCVIKKGRFLVSLETADLADPNAVSLT
ncbi:hypothetical protein DM01DRAFT_1336130 [Hesseltinella vesiculosa]|uniref:Uncharacterized protein n=1 Tax=Hesseltinella vesiculosa TaxID=101127 RepID=A0A1X2GGZ7_9FUNG|nr:hypothetical protein DM01DRAFT_1336130 [Hesseltinella vesiculosa]